jgi:predicted RNA-binding Zn ribbon-like protein
MHTETFDLDAGALCLDFSNTVEWRNSDHPDEHLNSYADLITWAEAADILPADRADLLRKLAEKQPEEAGVAYARAIALRETIYRLFAGYSGQGEYKAEDLALLNKTLSESLSHLRVVPATEGFAWGWAESPESLDEILWPVVRSAGDLLISEQLDRVSQCADDRGCGYLFVDTSRNHSRRWCSMESCGNRAKAQRHYKRQHET